MRRRFWPWLLVLAALGACAEPPTFAQVAPSLPPLAPDMARIFVYRDNDAYQNPAWVPVFFNGARVGAVGPGYVIMRDVPPGSYDISVASQGLYPNQDKVVAAASGQTFYAKIETVRGINPAADRPVPLTTYVVMLIDPQIAQREIQQRWYTVQNRADQIARHCERGGGCN
jgi:Protein of unknown function (DUF2846)